MKLINEFFVKEYNLSVNISAEKEIMGNIPVFSGSKVLEDIDYAVGKQNAAGVNSTISCTFPFDKVLVALFSAVPAACLTVLLFFSSSAFVTLLM